MSIHKEIRKVTTHTLQKIKLNGQKISMLTAYNYSIARILNTTNIKVLLVDNSTNNIMTKHETTLPITLNQMIYHASSVIRAMKKALVVVNLPFRSYQGNTKKTLNSTIQIIKQTKTHTIKLEGGAKIIKSIKKILLTGIPVIKHLSLTPQSIYKFNTYKVKTKEEAKTAKLKQNALLLQKAGCFALVLKKVPAKLAADVAKNLHIPIIGIGAGNQVDDQVLVTHNILDITVKFKPQFLHKYLNLNTAITQTVQQYISNIKSNNFPNNNKQY